MDSGRRQRKQGVVRPFGGQCAVLEIDRGGAPMWCPYQAFLLVHSAAGGTLAAGSSPQVTAEHAHLCSSSAGHASTSRMSAMQDSCWCGVIS